jgi:uncharacterized membrane protein YtjA (UPF0391 family)
MRYLLAALAVLALVAAAPAFTGVAGAENDGGDVACYADGAVASCIQPAAVVLDTTEAGALAGAAAGAAVPDRLLYEGGSQ